ncbi:MULTISPECIES: protein kinase family protein [unclassified Frankia]|uniref:protein kinase family protein n=3 Tax=Frankia TaxID=1854 RepID=UPI001EF60F07|nr:MULTISPECIES: protein kinase family protein [unclassified Frankia]
MVDGHNRPPLADVNEDVTSSSTRGADTMAVPASSPQPPDETGPMPPPGPDTLPIKTMLDGRYQLLSVMHTRGPVTLWRGDDRILARSVAVRVVQHSKPDARDSAAAARDRAAEMLLSAAIGSGRLVHPGAASTYDATSTTTDTGPVSYVVSEWVEGVSLQTLSAEGPLRPDQAATVMLAVARVLAAAHERGIHHGDLRPSDVIISGHGMVKVVDLGTGSVVAALEKGAHSQAEPWADSADLATDDVRAMGGLLYSALTGRWPLKRECGLPTAPRTSDGRTCSPRQVRAGVPRNLDALTLAVLGDDRASRPPIASAAELAEALEEIAPPEGTLDLGRVRIDDEPPMTRAMTPGPITSGYATAGYAADAAGVGPTGGHASGGYRGGNDGGAYPVSGGRLDNGAYPGGGLGRLPARQRGAARRRGEYGSPYRQGAFASPRRVLAIMVALLITLTLIIVAAIVLTRQPQQKTPAPPGPTASPTTPVGVLLPPPTATAFDPQGTDGDENNSEAPKAVDGNAATAWTTSGYNNTDGRQFGGLPKSGVGLRLDFGQPVTIRKMTVTFGGGPTSFELRAGDAVVNDVNSYPVVVGETTAAAGTADVPVPAAAGTHRYWVVWLTKLPTVSDGRFKGSIVDMSFHS